MSQTEMVRHGVRRTARRSSRVVRVLPGHALEAPFATFDISSLLSQMKREDTWRAARRNAVTLVKGRGPRVVLVAMHLGSTIAFNGTEGPVVLQVIEGRVRLNARPRASMLEAGCVALLQEEGAHGLEALEDSSLLLVTTGKTRN